MSAASEARSEAQPSEANAVASEAPVALSVVVAPVARGRQLSGALEALAAQQGAPRFEVIVPVDASIESVAALRERFAAFRFLDVPGTAELGRSRDPGVAHLAIDLRRSSGLAAARGEIVALVDETARPAPDWCARVAAAHRAPHAAIGGALACASDRALNWALFFMDAGRYQNPLPEAPATFISDAHVAYKRAALERTPVWRPVYHETGLHDALRAAGETLWLTPALELPLDRGAIGFGAALCERFAWARLYAGRRAREVAPRTRWLLAAGALAIAPLFLLRQTRLALARGRNLRGFARALPLLPLLDLVWAAGELVGYATGRATGRAPGPGAGSGDVLSQIHRS